jgi:hypothetical protein
MGMENVQPLQNSMQVPLRTKFKKQSYHVIQQIPLMGIYHKQLKLGPQRVVCTPMFIATFFIMTKTWIPHKCPSIDE